MPYVETISARLDSMIYNRRYGVLTFYTDQDESIRILVNFLNLAVMDTFAESLGLNYKQESYYFIEWYRREH